MTNSRVSVEKFEGVYYRPLKHYYKNRFDRTFDVCWHVNGRKYWKTIGRLSEGITPQIASEARLAILAKLRRQPVNDPTVDEIMQVYLKIKFNRHKNSYYIHHIHPLLGSLRLSELTLNKMEEFQNALIAKNLAPNSIRIIISNLSCAIKRAIVNQQWSGPNPTSSTTGFVRVKLNNKGERFLTKEEATELLKALEPSSYWHDAVKLSLLTGMRLCEIKRIRAIDIKPDFQLVNIMAKGQRAESVLLVPEALEILQKRARDKPPEALLFGSFTLWHFHKAIRKLKLNEGITDRRYKVWFHTMRHTFASWLAQAGVDIYAIQKLLRHKSILMTQRYAHLMPDHQRPHLEVVRNQLFLLNSGDLTCSS
jgi:integrase